MSSKPVIAVPACRRLMGIHPFHMVGEKYITALKEATEGLPWMIPAIGDDGILDDVLAKVDGLFLSGSYSDIQPHHYKGKPSRSGTLHDPERDAKIARKAAALTRFRARKLAGNIRKRRR